MIWRIYRYYNPIEDKSYVGQTSTNVNIRAGKNGYRYPKGFPFREAIDKYGWENFEQSILRLCTSQEEADQYERYFIEKYNTIFPNGYNMESGGKSGNSVNDISKQKMSDSKKGDKSFWYGQHHSEETKKKIAESLTGEKNPFYDKHHSKETKKKMADAKKGNTYTKGHKWFNNGVKNVMSLECPEGFIPGRLKRVSV